MPYQAQRVLSPQATNNPHLKPTVSCRCWQRIEYLQHAKCAYLTPWSSLRPSICKQIDRDRPIFLRGMWWRKHCDLGATSLWLVIHSSGSHNQQYPWKEIRLLDICVCVQWTSLTQQKKEGGFCSKRWADSSAEYPKNHLLKIMQRISKNNWKEF